jgi:hypothetical protein
MSTFAYAFAVLRAYSELIRYDVITACTGFAGIQARCRNISVPAVDGREGDAHVAAVHDAMQVACGAYWKRVLCLQRSACTAWLLRRHGVQARLVIGYRPVPFYAHAWVEVDGHVVNDAPVYRQRLRVLHVV